MQPDQMSYSAEEAMNEQEALAVIAATENKIGALEKELTRAVRQARTAGASWQSIGDMHGITRQAAHERYGPDPK